MLVCLIFEAGAVRSWMLGTWLDLIEVGVSNRQNSTSSSLPPHSDIAALTG